MRCSVAESRFEVCRHTNRIPAMPSSLTIALPIITVRPVILLKPCSLLARMIMPLTAADYAHEIHLHSGWGVLDPTDVGLAVTFEGRIVRSLRWRHHHRAGRKQESAPKFALLASTLPNSSKRIALAQSRPSEMHMTRMAV
jgi:hypothetical protein